MSPDTHAKDTHAKTDYSKLAKMDRLKLIVQQHQQGLWQEAEKEYLDFIEVYPDMSVTYNLLSGLMHQLQRYEEGIKWSEMALKIAPDRADYLLNMGSNHLGLEQFDEAIERYQQALDASPGHPQIMRSLAMAFYLAKRFQEATEAYDQASRTFPQDPEFAKGFLDSLMQYGDALKKPETLQRAKDLVALFKQSNTTPVLKLYDVLLLANEERYEEAYQMLIDVEEHLSHAEYWQLKSKLLLQLNKIEEAKEYLLSLIEDEKVSEDNFDEFFIWLITVGECDVAFRYQVYKKYLANDPENKKFLRVIIVDLVSLHKYREALEYVRKFQECDPEDTEGLYLEASVAFAAQHVYQAIALFNKVLRQEPGNIGVLAQLAFAYGRQRDLDKANGIAKQLAFVNPDNPSYWTMAFSVFTVTCDHRSIAEMDDLWENFKDTKMQEAAMAFLSALSYTYSREDIQQHLGIQQSFARGAHHSSLRSGKARELTYEKGQGPLRIGLLSSDLRAHSVMKFIDPLIEKHDKSKIELYCYSPFNGEADDIEKSMPNRVTHFERVSELSDRELVHKIQDHKVDILLELNGMTAHSRMGALNQRAAPVQIEWLGFPFTTGMETMDYMLLDPYLTPEDEDSLCEKPLIHPGAWCCFGAQTDEPVQEKSPFEENGYITFGTLNNMYKYSPWTLDLWASVLNKVPESKFLIVRPELNSVIFRANFIREMKERGVSEDRFEFFNNRAEQMPHTRCYDKIDICLDTYPLTGGTTTVDSLDMGVPVISLVGPAFHQRISYAVLMHAGLEEFCAFSNEEYTQLASDLASDPDRLRNYRQSIRQKLRDSALCDEVGFTRGFEDLMLRLSDQYNLR